MEIYFIYLIGTGGGDDSFKIPKETSYLLYSLCRPIVRRVNALVFLTICVFLIKLSDTPYLCFKTKLY